MSRSIEDIDAEIAGMWSTLSLMAEQRLMPLLVARQAFDAPPRVEPAPEAKPPVEVEPTPPVEAAPPIEPRTRAKPVAPVVPPDPALVMGEVIGAVAKVLGSSMTGRLHHHRIDEIILDGLGNRLQYPTRADAKRMRDRMVADGILAKGSFGMLSLGPKAPSPEPASAPAKRPAKAPSRTSAEPEPVEARPRLPPPPGDRVGSFVAEILVKAPLGLSRFEVVTRLEVRYGCCPSTGMLDTALRRYGQRLPGNRWGPVDFVPHEPTAEGVASGKIPQGPPEGPKPANPPKRKKPVYLTTNFEWTMEREGLFRSMVEAGASTRAISEALGPGASRNSLAGKAHRMGLKRPRRGRPTDIG